MQSSSTLAYGIVKTIPLTALGFLLHASAFKILLEGADFD
jgi:hypothetical protein